MRWYDIVATVEAAMTHINAYKNGILSTKEEESLNKSCLFNY